MGDNKLIKQAQLIKQVVTKQSAQRLDALHALLNLSTSLSTHFHSLSQHLFSSQQIFATQNITTWHFNLNTVSSILQNQVDLVADLMEDLSKQIKEISQQLQQEIDDIGSRNQTIWKQLNDHQRAVKEYYNKHKIPEQKHQKALNGEFEHNYLKTQINVIGTQYKKTFADFGRINDGIPNMLKMSMFRISKEINKLLGDFTLKKELDSINKENIRPQNIQKIVTEAIFSKFGDTDLLKTDRYTSNKKTQHFNELDKFTDYFLDPLITSVEEFMSIRATILQNDSEGQYFLDLLSYKIRGEVSLNAQKYQDLLSIIKYIFGNLIESKDPQHINKVVSILSMATKISHRNQYLSKDLNRYTQYWNSEELWKKIHKAVSRRNHGRKPINIKKLINNLPVPKLEGLKSSALLQISKFQKWLGFDSEEQQQQREYDIMKQINLYLTKLELNSEFSMRVLHCLAEKHGMSKQNLEKLIKFQYLYIRKQLQKSYMSPKSIKLRKEQQFQIYGHYPLVFAVKKSLKFLQIDQKLVQLRLVNKQWKEHLTEQIYCRCLKQEQNMQKIQRYRLPLYKILSNGYGFSVDKYREMINNVPQDFVDRDIVKLDVRRSLSWKPVLQTTLNDLLVTFAYYHQDTGYLQGMNYLAEHILRLTTGPQAYKIFQHIMVNQYSLVFNNSFDLLKLKIYQLMRLLQFHLPRLFNHFLRQGIEGEHFLIAWSITLWGQYSGEITWVVSDGFMIDGWRWWMSVCLWVLSRQEQKLLEMDFERIMRYFSEMNCNAIFKGRIDEICDSGRMKEEIQQLKVSDEMLQQIRKEYFMSIKKLKQLQKE